MDRSQPVRPNLAAPASFNRAGARMNEKSPAITCDPLVDGLANMVGHHAERELQMVEGAGSGAAG